MLVNIVVFTLYPLISKFDWCLRDKLVRRFFSISDKLSSFHFYNYNKQKGTYRDEKATDPPKGSLSNVWKGFNTVFALKTILEKNPSIAANNSEKGKNR